MYILYIYLYVSGFNFITPNTKHFLYFDKKKFSFIFGWNYPAATWTNIKNYLEKSFCIFSPKNALIFRDDC